MKFKYRRSLGVYDTLMMVALGIVATSFLFNIAFAAGTSATLRWTLATKYTNGSTLAATDIKETLIEWRVKGQTALVGSARIASPAATTVVNLGAASCGEFDFIAKTVLKDTAESDPTAAVPYDTGVKCRPMPPTNVSAS